MLASTVQLIKSVSVTSQKTATRKIMGKRDIHQDQTMDTGPKVASFKAFSLL